MAFLALSVFGWLLVAAGVLGYQIILYLKDGVWQPLSVIDGLLYLTQKSPSPWLLYPQDWIGVHNLFEKIPLSLALVFLAVLWGVLGGMVVVKLQELNDEYNEKLKDRLRRKQQE